MSKLNPESVKKVFRAVFENCDLNADMKLSLDEMLSEFIDINISFLNNLEPIHWVPLQLKGMELYYCKVMNIFCDKLKATNNVAAEALTPENRPIPIYDPVTNTITFYAPNIKSVSDVRYPEEVHSGSAAEVAATNAAPGTAADAAPETTFDASVGAAEEGTAAQPQDLPVDLALNALPDEENTK